ncbi:DUF4301 family protein [Flavobacterium amnicola]|uniref:DUF4301 family protein n=1 Tax=Flavobacterium amnicola TaxID=2506422 RepID=A0A4Q1K6E1_9FLAO|nr:DUF4301 family protein [Flavobacterium amnicola]RXR20764.1 DUF4301 family protein [Flavobacterium amnicola]
MEKTFSQTDLNYISKRGNSLDKIMQQLYYFKNGIPKINLHQSATIGNGILCPDATEKSQWVTYFDQHKSRYTIQKFVPASGAATRMFQFLNEFLNRFNPETDTINSYVNKYNDTNLSVFIVGIRNFPFYTELKEKTKKLFPDYPNYSVDKKVHAIIFTLLDKKGLDFASKPKGILPFHLKEDLVETPIDEHVWEAAFFVKENQKTKIHFTVSVEFQNDFERILSKYPNIEATFSYQDQSSDTIAVDANNTPFRLEDGSLFFRPGGHGALIENLNQLTSDIIFIKNIDNVSQIGINELIENKKVLGGILLHTQFHVFEYLKLLHDGNCPDDKIEEIKSFVESTLSFPLTEDFARFQKEYQKEYLIKILNRPIRVCGMVRNEGEPGGGPFWVKDDKGRLSLQIVESSQVNLSDKTQKNILHNATHFNPVDIVCGVKDFQGNKFDLNKFVDPEAAFITEKTKLGKPIKAFELPGLWNGAMAKWSTIFVEVPLSTFNPVKTVNDLLKPAHQANHE